MCIKHVIFKYKINKLEVGPPNVEKSRFFSNVNSVLTLIEPEDLCFSQIWSKLFKPFFLRLKTHVLRHFWIK